MRYEIKVVIDSERSEDNVALYTYGVLVNHFDVEDVSVRHVEE